METKIFGLLNFDWTQSSSEANTNGDTSRIFSSDIYNVLRISVGVEDDTDMNVDQTLESLRMFIRSKRNIALGRILFEQR